MRSLLTYEARKALVISSLVAYCMIGFGIKFITNEKPHEIYPFFSWFLFADIPFQRPTFSIEILQFRGAVYDPPRPFSDTMEMFEFLNQSPTQFTPIITLLGRAIEKNDADAVEEHRERLEAMFSGDAAIYRVIKSTHDPIEYWKSGVRATTTNIATFTVSAQ